jgi:hypothetical protein
MRPLLLSSLALVLLTAPAFAEEPNATLTVTAPDHLKVAEKGAVSVTIVPKKEWKISKEAPTQIRLSDNGKVSFAKAKLHIADGEIEGKTFQVSSAIEGKAAGAGTITAKITYFMCTATVCKRFTAKRTVDVAVK